MVRMRWCSEAISLSGTHTALLTHVSSSFLQFHNHNHPFFFKFKFKFKFNNCFSSSSSSYTSLTHHLLKPLAARRIQNSSSKEEENNFDDFVVVNFYHFVFINDPQQLVAKHLSFVESEVLFFFLFSFLLELQLILIFHSTNASNFIVILHHVQPFILVLIENVSDVQLEHI